MRTKCQDELMLRLQRFSKSKTDYEFLLRGSAGTGKTWALGEAVDLFRPGTVIGVAPTHKAVKVLSERLPGIPCVTVHSFLGLRPAQSAGKTKLIKRGTYDPTELAGFSTVLLDEASMCSTEIMHFIRKDIKCWNRKYIYSGDFYQLPPPGELYSPLSEGNFGDNDFELMTVVRQVEGSPIIRQATEIRESIRAGRQPVILFGKNEHGSVVQLRKDHWEERLLSWLEAGKGSPDYFRIIAYRNQRVREYNQHVRQVLGYPSNVPFSKGEKVYVNSAFIQAEEVIFQTGEEFIVDELIPYTHDRYDLAGWEVSLLDIKTGAAVEHKPKVLDTLKYNEAYKRNVNNLLQSARVNNFWGAYYQLLEFWCDLRPLYSLTAHTSQGSTFDNVAVDVKDIYTCRPASEADRCFYVAVTRPKHNVVYL